MDLIKSAQKFSALQGNRQSTICKIEFAQVNKPVYTSPMKIIISARRENNQIVFYKGWNQKNEMSEFQTFAFNFKDHYLDPYSTAQEKINEMKEQFAGLSDWKVEEIKE